MEILHDLTCLKLPELLKPNCLIITIGDIDKSRKLVELAAKHYPHLKIAANASDRSSAYDLMDLGITQIRRETFGSALAIGRDALQLLGTDPLRSIQIDAYFPEK